jgi:hypothetical protein
VEPAFVGERRRRASKQRCEQPEEFEEPEEPEEFERREFNVDALDSLRL